MSRSGTCPVCKTEQLLASGRLVDHRQVVGRSVARASGSGYPKGGVSSEQDITVRCQGYLATCVEDRERQREKARGKRRVQVLAVRDEASVLLDALLLMRGDLDEEFPKERRQKLLDIALVGFRLEHPKARKITNGVLWWTGTIRRGERGHKLFCRFCGFLVARFPIGAWAKLAEDERQLASGLHVFTCALQFLAGIRKTPDLGTMLDGYDGVLFDDAIGRDCPACGAAAGTTCVEIGGLLFGPSPGIGSLHREPHDARRSAKPCPAGVLDEHLQESK